jgi:hypothetical protein
VNTVPVRIAYFVPPTTGSPAWYRPWPKTRHGPLGRLELGPAGFVIRVKERCAAAGEAAV